MIELVVLWIGLNDWIPPRVGPTIVKLFRKSARQITGEPDRFPRGSGSSIVLQGMIGGV